MTVILIVITAIAHRNVFEAYYPLKNKRLLLLVYIKQIEND
jgi:hypothetical protein